MIETLSDIGFKKTEKQSEAVRLMATGPRFTLLYGGSRSGKSFIIIRQIFIRALKEPGSRHLIVRFAFNHAKQSLWYDTIPKCLALCFPGYKPTYNKSDWFIEFHNGSQVWIGGLDDKDRTEKVLGNEYATIFINEASQVSYSAYTTVITRLAQNTKLHNRVFIDCNPPSTQHWIFKLFMKNENPDSGEKIDGSLFSHLRMNPDDNLENLPEDYITSVLGTLSLRQQRRFRLGEFVDDVEGALWTYDMIDSARVTEAPELKRIVIAIDPAVTSNKDSDETGVVVAGKAADGSIYVLDDISGVYTPKEWAGKVLFAYDKWEADKIIAEVNNGGDMVETILRNFEKNISYDSVHATRGKFTRAEPVQALYEQKRVHHVGQLPKLEDQMTSWSASTEKSPDRVDALVWAVTYLMGEVKTNDFWVA